MRRVAALVLSIMLAVAALLPLVNYSSAHRNSRPSLSRRHRGHRHSRAWWRRYRARMKQRRAAAQSRQRRVLSPQSEHKAVLPPLDIERPLLPQLAQPMSNSSNDARSSLNTLSIEQRRSTTPVMANGRTQFRLFSEDGKQVGQASLSGVNNVSPGNVALMNARAQRRQLAGVSYSDLRRQIIEKMLTSGGWVVNDMEREINGRQVFVVVAQTAASSDGRTPPETWNFYFTEIDGRIYSLSAHAPSNLTEQMGTEAEKVLATLPTSNRSVLTSKSPR